MTRLFVATARTAPPPHPSLRIESTPPLPHLQRLGTADTLSTTYPCRILHAARPPLAVPIPIADAVLGPPLDSTLWHIGYNSHLHLHAQCTLRPLPFPALPFSFSTTCATTAIATHCAHHTLARFSVTFISAGLGCRIFHLSLTTFFSPSSPSIILHAPTAALACRQYSVAIHDPRSIRGRAFAVRQHSDGYALHTGPGRPRASTCIRTSPSSLCYPCVTEKDGEHNADVHTSYDNCDINAFRILVHFAPAFDHVTASGIRYPAFFGSVPFLSLGRQEIHKFTNAEEDFEVLPRTMSLKASPPNFHFVSAVGTRPLTVFLRLATL
ncbi:hypothetical protein B0H13DRAFT_2302490 [Mycena leptocephala]|nr:hypothetical protein B0H13DRAFT_2302490 [Mycena leptocephala]